MEYEEGAKLRAAIETWEPPQPYAHKQTTHQTLFGWAVLYEQKSQQWHQIMNVVAYYFVKDMPPIATVE